MLDETLSTASLRSALGGDGSVAEVRSALTDLRGLGLNGSAAAAWIRSLDGVVARTRAPDLVWSGPEVPGLHARDTRRVYEELLGNAERSLWVCTYAFFDGPRAFEVLARRMDATPALRTILLLNIQRKRGDTTAADQLVRRFADRFWGSDWPGATRPQVFYDPRSLDVDAPGGVLHAKAVVADDEVALVTSANLTEAALDRNIEVGLLVHDRCLALTLSSHFRALIDVGLLHALPSD
jgi:phosphatidylserine/phosphatidylglycerophosphate/cardiolipin synthase-like enzyme